MTTSLMRVHQLRKMYTDPERIEILKGIDFAIAAGETLAIIGTSGEGKTTLLHHLALLEAPTSGWIEIEGKVVHPIDGTLIRRDLLAIVFQFYHLIESWTALDNALLPAMIAGDRLDEATDRCHELLHRLQLNHRAHTFAGLLSGGEKQRLCLARALLRRPKLLLADEFTGNLDRDTAKLVADLLFEQIAFENAALILVTHDLDLAKRCQRHLRIEGGQLRALSLS